MPDERREFHKIRPASHTLLSVNYLYQMNMEKRKGVFTKLRRDPARPYAESLALLLNAISFVIMLSPYGVRLQQVCMSRTLRCLASLTTRPSARSCTIMTGEGVGIKSDLDA